MRQDGAEIFSSLLSPGVRRIFGDSKLLKPLLLLPCVLIVLNPNKPQKNPKTSKTPKTPQTQKKNPCTIPKENPKNLLWTCRHRHVPKAIYKASKLRQTVYDAEKQRDQRRRAHSTPGSIPRVPARKKKIVAEVE